jgi:D-serine deaminase-like pyridoxal phosphate-dependent protein
VVALAAGRRPESRATVAGHPRWRRRPGVRDALLANPVLPGEAAEALLADATREDLALTFERKENSPAIRAAAQRALAQRAQQD